MLERDRADVLGRKEAAVMRWGILGLSVLAMAWNSACKSPDDYCTEYEMPSKALIKEVHWLGNDKNRMMTIKKHSDLMPFHPLLAQCLAMQCKESWWWAVEKTNGVPGSTRIWNFHVDLRWQGSHGETIKVAEDLAYELGGWVEEHWFGGFAQYKREENSFEGYLRGKESMYTFSKMVNALVDIEHANMGPFNDIKQHYAWIHWTRRYLREIREGMCIAAGALLVVPCVERSEIEKAAAPYLKDGRIFLLERWEGCRQ